MNYSKTSESDFSILKNGIDSQLEIIRHDHSGFYNITKIAKLIGELMLEQPDRYHSKLNKCNRPYKWFENDSTKELITTCKKIFGLDELHYELSKGTPKKFAGTYVHRKLYDLFLSWLDPGYAIRVATILDQIHQDANIKLIQEKDCKIDALTEKVDQQTAKIDQLLAFGNKIIGQNNKLQLTVDMTREELSESLDYLVDKSYHSTIDPENPSKVTHFAILAPDNEDRSGRTILVRGQAKHIRKVIESRAKTHTPVVDCRYNANAINLINNAQDRYNLMIRDYIQEYNVPINKANEKLKNEIREHNAALARMIRSNKSTTMVKRSLSDEKQDTLTLSDIPISFKLTYIQFKPNEHFSYDQVLSCITEMNELTQKSPLDPHVDAANTTDDSSSECDSD